MCNHFCFDKIYVDSQCRKALWILKPQPFTMKGTTTHKLNEGNSNDSGTTEG